MSYTRAAGPRIVLQPPTLSCTSVPGDLGIESKSADRNGNGYHAGLYLVCTHHQDDVTAQALVMFSGVVSKP